MPQKVAEFEECSSLYRRWVRNGVLETVVNREIQMMSTTVSGLMAQADAALPEEPDKITQLLEWLNQLPGVAWGLAIFALIAMAVAAIAALTGNLDKIFSFRTKYLSRTDTELSEQQLENLRRQLLKQMKTDVARRLEDSLHNLVRVDLEQEEQRHRVGRQKEPLAAAERKQPLPFKDLIQRSLSIFKNSQATKPVAPAEKTYSIFHRADIGERLLILGEPGAGKTTELLTITQRLVDAAIDDNTQPIPLIFELSSWEPDIPVLSWLGQQLQKSYGVSSKLAQPLAQQWIISQDRLILLLDGLDELGQRHQLACIEALEAFFAQHPALQAIVCCRREEYEQGGAQLRQLKGAIYLQAVGLQQIQQYLKDLGREQLWSDLQNDARLLQLAESPLFLTMLVIAYQGQPIRDTEALFNAYIHKQLHDLSHQGIYKPGKEKSPQQTLRYLTWLSRQLKERKETEFLIENLQPDWLASKRQRQVYRLISGLSGGLIVGLSSGLISGLSGGLISGLIVGLIAGGPCEIEPQEQLKWSLRKGLSSGLISGLIVGLISGPFYGPFYGLFYGLIAGLIVGLFYGLLFGLIGEAIEQKQVPNQGIQKGIQNGLSGGLIVGLLFGLIGGLSFVLINGLSFGLIGGLSFGLSFGLIVGLSFGLIFGLIGAIQHLFLRIFLTKNGDTPWNYAQFLEHAARHRFIQRTGGRYRFVHDLLRQHFAQMTPQQQALLAQKSQASMKNDS